ncbi:MAG: hypothetical protein ACRCU5_15740 [Rhizobiaceae bacterium]
MTAQNNAWHGGEFWRARHITDSVFSAYRPKPATTAVKPVLLWPGAQDGIRAPMADETPLSESEVRYARMETRYA